ncbi:MAG: aminopeptidase P N-terminal domain-containing protein, partial [Pseudomonadota bacterium]
MFGPRIYQDRRDLLKKRLGGGILLFPGNVPSPVNYPANVHPFRQDSVFLYYFGLNR